MQSYLPSILILGPVAILAYILSQQRESPPELHVERASAAKVLLITTLLQTIHFIEELSTGFNIKLGEMLDLPGMPLTFFILFNLIWLGIWILSIFGLRSGNRFSFFAAWFLAIAGILNAILHPILSLRSGSYFPGTLSAPFVGIAGFILLLRLKKATSRSPADIL